MASVKYLNGILTVLTVLTVVLALQLWTSWAGSTGGTPAFAQGIPDAGAQREQIVDQLKLVNKKVDQINQLLESGKIRVTVVNLPETEDE